ncbi:MAG: HEAT repeat domain-containing protein [Nitrospirae bacterium]|nr:MAG: HEAT repeat domain-containing protein [Nitrospirota bacterium]
MDDKEFVKMVADYMEKGFLENIVDMFKHDTKMYEILPHLIRDERIRVRIGATALVEELLKEDPQHVKEALPYLIPLLKDENPTVRGDAANLIALISPKEAIRYLKPLTGDPNHEVAEFVKELLEELNGN